MFFINVSNFHHFETGAIQSISPTSATLNDNSLQNFFSPIILIAQSESFFI